MGVDPSCRAVSRGQIVLEHLKRRGGVTGELDTDDVQCDDEEEEKGENDNM